MKRFLILAVILGASWSSAAPALATGDNGQGHIPVTVCHKPGTPAQHQLTFDISALYAHLAHGDSLGACPAPPAPPVVCPEGTEQISSSGPLVCLKTERVEVVGPTVYVDRPVPGPERIVEVVRYRDLPVFVEKMFTRDVPVFIKVKVKVKGKTVVKWKKVTKVKIVKSKRIVRVCPIKPFNERAVTG